MILWERLLSRESFDNLGIAAGKPLPQANNQE